MRFVRNVLRIVVLGLGLYCVTRAVTSYSSAARVGYWMCMTGLLAGLCLSMAPRRRRVLRRLPPPVPRRPDVVAEPVDRHTG